MKNSNKSKYRHHNLSPQINLNTQKNILNLKSTFLKKDKKLKQSAHVQKDKKLKIISNQYYPQNLVPSKSQNILNNLTKFHRKKQSQFNIPHIQSAVNSVPNEKISLKNSKSKSKFVQKPLKNKSQQFKFKKDPIRKLNPQLNKNLNLNTRSKQTSKYFKSSSNNSQKHKSLIDVKKKSKSGNKLIKNTNDFCLNMNKKCGLQKFSKSSCITRNVSKNNSKEKQYRNTQKELNQKFKKKTLLKGGLQKKAKMSQVYSSMKISPRNSFKFVETKSNQFLILSQYDSTNPQHETYKKQKKDNCFNVEIKKMKSQKNIYQRLKDYVDSKNESFIETNQKKDSFKKSKQFSFLQLCHLNKVEKNNKNQVSIQRLLQTTQNQINFKFQCQETIKQKNNGEKNIFQENQKQEQFFSLQKLQQLTVYQSQYFNQRSYSTNSQLFRIALENQVNFRQMYVDRNQKSFLQRIQILDRMSELSSQLLLKTQTYHLAVAYYDIYLSMISKEIICKEQSSCQSQKQKLKLIGLGCMLVAIKMDERQYEFDILNAIMSLENSFSRKQIIRSEFQILKKLRLKLKIQTLSFWLDYLSSKWDQYILTNLNPLKQTDKLLLRSVDGRSYQNYRKVVSILNAILLDGGIFKFQLIEIVVSVFYAVFSEIINQEFKENVLQQIDCSKDNVQNSIIDQKSNFKNYATRDTLDQLSQSDLKQNSPQNYPNTNILTNSLNKIKIHSNQYSHKKMPLQNSLTCFRKSFSQFVYKTCKRNFTCLKDPIKYIQTFLELKMDFQMDQRIYEEARNYEEFVRYHTHLPFSKQFVNKKYLSQKISKQKSSNVHLSSDLNLTQNLFSQKKLSQNCFDHRTSSHNDDTSLKRNSNLDQILFQKVEKVFQNKQKNVLLA